MTIEKWIEIETEYLGHAPDMKDCPIPILYPINVVPYQLFMLVKDQLIVTGMGDIIGVNMQAVISLLDLYGHYLVEDKTVVFEKIWAACNVYVNYLKKMVAEKSKQD
jgi:hypothetical protein